MAYAYRIIWVLVLGAVGLFVQGTLLKLALGPRVVVPNLVLALVAFLAFHEVSMLGVALAFVLGLMCDFYSGVMLGPWAGAFVVVFAALSSLSQRLFVDSPAAAVIAVLVSSALASIVYLSLDFQFNPSGTPVFSISFVFVLEGLVTAACAPVVFALLRKVLPDAHIERY